MVTATPDASSLAEVLDRILDKGIVVDVWARISLVGIEILTVESRVVVASVDTFLHYSEEMAKIEQAAIGATPESLHKSDFEIRSDSCKDQTVE